MTTRVIILNWNGRHWLERSLAALARQTRPADEIVVVDNGSADDSVAWLRAQWPAVQVLDLGANLGFAAGNNRGAAGAGTDALVFLNNDTEPEPDWLAALVAAADGPDAPDLVTSRIVYLDRPDLIDSAGDGYLRCGGGFKMHHGQPAASAPGTREVFGACGAAFLIRRTLFEALGGFTESFFMVYEDVDLSYRARLRGARVWYESRAVVGHAGSASLGRVSALAVRCGQRNLEWVWLVNTPASLWWRSLLPHLAYSLAAVIGYTRQGHLRSWCLGKWDVVRQWRTIRRRRADVQATRVVAPSALWSIMEPDWWRVKRAEKRFDFRA